MAIRRGILAAGLLALAPFTAGAAEAQLVLPDAPSTALVSGKGYQFFLDAPKGWILDNQSGAKRGLTTVFYPKGQSFKDAPAVLYANVAPRDGGEPLEAFVDREIARARTRSPELQVQSHRSIETKDGKTALVRSVSGDVHRNLEALAFVADREAFVIVVLSARDRASFDGALPAFAELVRSYATVGSDAKVIR